MTKFPANGAGVHEAGSLGVSRSSSSAEGAYVLRALWSYMFCRLALEAAYRGWGDGIQVGDKDRVTTGSCSHNHFQSSGEHNAAIPHSRSSSLVSSTPTPLSWCLVPAIMFPNREWSGSCMVREGMSSSG